MLEHVVDLDGVEAAQARRGLAVEKSLDDFELLGAGVRRSRARGFDPKNAPAPRFRGFQKMSGSRADVQKTPSRRSEQAFEAVQ